jgi:ribonuclease-3
MLRKFLRNFFQISDIRKKNHFNFQAIESRLNYQFNNKDILSQAFKHSSFLAVTKEDAYESNERLEFLGDAVLDLVVTEFLYLQKPYTQEGELTKIKSVLVSRGVLAEVVANLELGQYLLMDRGEEKTGGKERNSNLSNLYESIIGAIYLDGGLKQAHAFILNSLLKNYEEFIINENFINYKSILLEHTQAECASNPVYRLQQETGPDHEKEFVMNVSVKDIGSASGKGRSKKIAEQESAKNLLREIAPQLIEKDG